MWRIFLIAGRFLTRLPLPDPGPISAADLGRSVAFYPLVGLVIGLLICGLSMLLMGIGEPDPGLVGALVLVAWVWLTGGLHLDGLADTADAWIGGLGDRSRTLEIMKDPRSGPFGVMALVLALLCKWTALAALVGAASEMSLLWIPVLARAQVPVLFLATPYVRAEGMGAEVKDNLPGTWVWAWLALPLVACVFFAGQEALVLIGATGILFMLWRRSMMARLGGFTGDTAGALVELSETLMLAVAAFHL